MRRILVVGVVLAALPATTVWASRCGGYAETSIVFCDDFDQYCTANNPTNPWPGYPPSPDTKCATNATADSSFFRQSSHWPSFCGTDSTQMGIETDSWGPERASTNAWGVSEDSVPFYARLYGGLGVTAQYHRWDLVPTVAAKHPGKNAINGTDANPLYLRFYLANNGSPVANSIGYPPNAPMYVELALDEERAPTDYVVKDCAVDTQWQGVHDCNCATSNPDATCDKGTCAGAPQCSSGVCAYMECDTVTHTCPTACGSLYPGKACTQDSDCSACVGGFHDGTACSANNDPVCKVCDSGTRQGLACTNQDSCPGNGTCTSGPHTGNNCRNDGQCGACVGGSSPGANCSSDVGCQVACGSGQSATCQDGPHQGVACVHDSPDCDGGAYYPIVVQQRLNTQIDPVKVPHPPVDPNLLRKSLAYGLLAQLDVDPCNLENGRRPTNYHSNVFDGNLWTDLRANVFPGNGGKFNSDGLSAVYQMWVKTDTFVIWLDSTVGGINNGVNCLLPQHSEATVPRKYKGPFNRIAIGVGPGCRVDPTTGACITGYSCWDYPKSYGLEPARWHEYSIDNLVMTDGVPTSSDGACCKNDATCTDGSEANCLAQGGHFQGWNTTCAATVCCPYPFADVDKDGDVDQDDFGAFQICYTGQAGGVPAGCSCYDRDKDNDVDVDDFTAFSNCWSGPNVPWSALLAPTCAP